MIKRSSYLRSLGPGVALATALVLAVAVTANWISPRTVFGPIETAARLVLSGGISSPSVNAPAAIATVGSGGTYATLKAAFDDINSGSGGLTGSIQLNLVGDTTETATASLNASGAGPAAYASVLIRPSGGAARTISGSIPAGSPLIDLNGADNVTIDGLNSGGNSLTVSNTTASAVAGTSTIRFREGATNNIVTNTTLRGSFAGPVNTDGGTVFFGSDSSTVAGNDNNTISNNDIGPAGSNLPTKAVYLSGSTSTTKVNNSGNVVDNNNIFDYFGTAVPSAGVYVAAGATGDSFTNNRFYQTSPRSLATAAQHSAIWISNTTGNNFQVAGNTIGFASAAGTGVYGVVAGDAGAEFVPIYLEVGTSSPTSVEGNTIAGIAMSGAAAGIGSAAPLRLIYVNAGLTRIGDAAGNTIGSQTTLDSITYTSSSTSPSDVIGISNFGATDWVTNNNNIGGLSASNTGSGAANIYGLRANTATAVLWTVQGNTVGGIVANSIRSTSTASGSRVQAIVNSSAAATVVGNKIQNLTAAGGTGTAANASVAGIVSAATGSSQLISRNTISGLANSHPSASTVVTGIQFSGSTGGNTVEQNLIRGLTSATNSTSAEINGIRVAGGNTTYRNNFIIVGAGVSNSIGAPGTSGISGINEPSGTDNFYNNSVYVGGSPTAGAGSSFAFNSTQTTSTRIFRNNIFVNGRANAGTATGKNYAVRVGGTAPNPAGLTINNNVYFASGAGSIFGLFNSLDVADLAGWKGAVGQDANSISGDPLFVSAADLHLTSGSPALDVGAASLGVANDFDNKGRPGGNLLFDIGASEFDGTLPPANEMQASEFIDPVSGGTELAGEPFLPKATFSNNGTSSQTNVTVRYRICTDASCTTVLYNQTAIIASIAALASQTVVFPSATVPSAGSYVIKAKAELAADADTSNDEISGTLTVQAALNGSYTIGAAGTYATLGDAVGQLEALGVSGPVTMTLTDASYSTGETFPIVIKPIPGASATNTITIKPAAGVTPAISGSSASCLLTLSGADHLTIDGSNNGTSSRDLTITNTDAGTSSAVVCLQTTASLEGASNDTFKNINIAGSGNSNTLFGIFSGASGAPSTVSLGTGNSSNTFLNNKISKVQYGIYSQGASSAAKNSGNVISQNVLNSAAPDNVSKGGILVGFENDIQITQNRVSSIAQTGVLDIFGIALGLTDLSTTTFGGNDVTNATVTRNFVGTVVNNGGFSAAGITIASTTSGTNLIANNSIFGVAANGTGGNFGAGILIGGGTGSTTRVFYNSVSMTGTLSSGTNPNYCLAIGGTDPSVDVRNNAFYNTLVSGSGVSFDIGTASGTFANLTSDYNDFFVTGGGGTFKTGKTGGLTQGSGAEQVFINDWIAATGKDTPHSTAADPLFRSSSDLQPQTISTILGAGTAIAGITTDINGNARSGATPSIGAYETGIDTLGPAIAYAPLAKTAGTGNRTLSITVSDPGGVPTTGAGLPRIYFRKGTSDPFSANSQCSFVSGSGYDCVIDYSQVTGGSVAAGDTVQYFVAGQDAFGNVTAYPSGGAGGFTSSPPAVSTPPTSPDSYIIAPGFSGAIGVGSAQTYTSLTNDSPTGLFKAMNSGVLTGNLTVNITSDLTVEDGAVALNQLFEEGTGGYRVTFKASGGSPRTISGSSPGALITLNGADRITFDGTNTSLAPVGAGDNLSIVNNNAGTSSAVIWVQSAAGANGATDNIFKNLNITGNSAATTLVGVGFGGPVISTSSLGTGNNLNRVEGCDIQKAQYGIYSQGASAANKNTGNVFTLNTLSAASPNNLSKGGIITGFENSLQITQNNISNIAQAGTPDVFGISLGIQSLTTAAFAGNEVTNATVSRNVIGSIRNTGTFSACGICVAPALSGVTQVSNNVISGVSANGTAGHMSVGMFAGGGTGSTTQLYFNSVSMTGVQTGGNDKSYGLAIAGGDPTVNIRNNALFNTQNNGSGSNYAIGSGSTTFANMSSNFNDLFVANDASHFVGSTSSLTAAVNQASLSNWTAATGKDTPNSLNVDPQFLSATDLHVQSISPILSSGTPVGGITTDITGAIRSAAAPSIGAYEAGVDTLGPTVTYTPLAKTTNTSNRTLSVSVTDPSGVPTSGVGLPRIYFRKGNSDPFTAFSQCTFVAGITYNCVINYALVSGGGVATGDTIQYFVVAQDAAGNVNANPSAGVGGLTPNPPAASTPPTVPNSYLIAAGLSGAMSVGTGQTFTSLTRNDAGGLFRFINQNIVSGDITINITSDLLLEDGSVALNEFPSPFAMTIMPSAAPRTISGTSAGSTALIKLNGADRVTITGSVDGAGTDRSLTISDSNSLGAVLWIASAGATDGSSGNTIQYCNISGSGAAGTIAGLLAGSGSVFGNPAEAANDNNTFRGNVVTRVQNGVYINGKASGGDTNWVFSDNIFGSTSAADKLSYRGLFLANTAQASVLLNTISGVVSPASSTLTMSGIMISGLANGGQISRNQISDIKQMNPAGFGSNGLYLASSAAASNLLISNNFISDVASRGKAGVTADDNGFGIVGISGGGYRIYNNTVSLNTDQASASGVTAAVNVGSGVSAAGAIDLRNNILSNTQTIGTRYAIYVASAAGAGVFSAIDWNDYFAPNVGFLGSPRVTLANWQAASGHDAASQAADPQFVSAADLHLLQASTMVDSGTSIVAVTNDIDGDARPTFAGYDIGADEYVDRIAPDTTIDTKPTDPSTVSTAHFTFSGTDAGGSGIAGFECQLDAAAFAACTSPADYSGLSQGSHTFSVRAKDAAGNTDPSPASHTWVVDAIPPDTLIVGKPSNPSNVTTATFVFTGSDSVLATVAGFECKLDAEAFAACTSPKDYTGLAEGSHIFQVRTVDGAGNVDPSPATYTWTVDSIAPDTQIVTPPPSPSSSTSVVFNFTGTDTGGTGVASFECKLDAAAFAACTSPKSYSALTEGSHNFQVRAIDTAGNTDQSPAIATWTVDSVAPDTQISVFPENPRKFADATFEFTGTDTGGTGVASFECKLDTGAFADCTTPKNYTGLAEGSHTFQVRAIDLAGNADASPASHTWVVDTVAPETQISSSPTNPSKVTDATFVFNGTDTGGTGVARFECKLDSAAFAVCISPEVYSGLAEGSHTFQVRAIDTAGNVDASPASLSWVVDSIAPDTQIVTKPTDPSNSAAATFEFTGTDTGGTGVATFECKLDAGAFAACTSPKDYTALAQGSHNFQVRAIDVAGNVDASPATYTWLVDAIAPDTQILPPTPPNPSNSPDATFTFSGTDSFVNSVASFECKLDGAPFTTCTSPIPYTGLADGPHQFQVRAVDAVGNKDATPASYTWNIVYPIVVTATAGNAGPTKYVTLKAAFDAINSGVHQRDITIAIVGNTIETASAVINESGTGSTAYTSLNIRSSGGAARNITGNIAGPLIDLNGADSVSFNGMVSGASGLTISNTSTQATASTIRLINDACLNSFLNTTLLGSSSGLGVVYFGPGTILGNDNNNFISDKIGAANGVPAINGIYSVGLNSSVDNSGNSISGVEIFDYFNANASSNGVDLLANNSGWVIANSSFYQTAPRTFLTAATHSGINITSGAGYSISGNTIGYANANGTGTYVMAGAVATRFVGINLAVGTSDDTFVQSNQVASISLTTSSGVATTSGVLCGLNIISGNVKVGDSAPNTFGSTLGVDSLVAVPSTTQGAVVGINTSSTGTVVIKNNRFGGFTSANPAAAIAGAVFGINVSASASSTTVTGNTIGNSTPDNMRAGVLGTTTGDSLAVGINAAPAIQQIAVYSNNTIQNFSSYGTGTGGYVRGIQTGTAPSLTASTTVNFNTISNLKTTSALPALQSGNTAALGIQFLPGANSTITGNTISNIADLNAGSLSTVVAGITHGSATRTTISNNVIYGLSNASTGVSPTSPPVIAGIVIRSGTTSINVQNNMISLGSGLTTNTAIIGIWGNHGAVPDPVDNIYYNTVNIEGTAASGLLPSMAFYRGDFGSIARTSAVDIRNNVFNNTRSGGTGKHYAIANNYGVVASSAVGWPAGASNYNVLNANPATVGYWTTNQSFASWKVASASDSRSLSGIAVAFVNSANNLHIASGLTPTALESGGTPIAGVTTDIDGQARPGPAGSINGAGFAPDLGADEIDGVYLDAAPPVISYTPLVNLTSTADRVLSINITDTTAVASGANLPRIYYKKSTDASYVSNNCLLASGTPQNGSYSCPINNSLMSGGSVSRGDAVQYFVVAQDTNGNVAANPSAGFVGSGVNSVTTPPTPNTYLISGPITGNMDVGTSGPYNSLTNPGGVFEAINAGVVTGNVNVRITSDLMTETGAISLNQTTEEGAGGYTITIRPFGGQRTISGNSNDWIIRLLDSDRVTIEGSLTGGTANAVGGDAQLRDLTIVNTSVTAGAGGVVAISGASNGSQNITIRNVNISGVDATQTQVGLHIGGPTVGVNGGPNNFIRIENCSFQKAGIGIYDEGLSAAAPGSGHVMTMNDLSATSILRLRRAGMLIFNQDGLQVTMNSVGGIVDDEGADAYGIGVGIQGFDASTVISGGITNALISRNKINGVVNLNSLGFSGVGIGISGGPGGANVISNNMISGVAAMSTSPDITAGIFVAGAAGSNTKVYFNSVSMTGDRGAQPGQIGSYGIAMTGADPTVELKDNILYTTQTSSGGSSAKSYSIGMVSSTFANLNSNYNDFVAMGPNAAGFRTGGLGSSATDIATLAGWRSATGKDLNSKEFDPSFFDPVSDLHLLASSALVKAGTAAGGINIDFDGNTRSGPTYDMGADEVDQTAPDTQILTHPASLTSLTTAQFSFSGTDSLVNAVASYQCKLDAALFNTCSSPVTYNGLAQGTHTFQVRAIDGTGNVDPTPASFVWTIDTNAPDTQIGNKPPDLSNSASATISFSGLDSVISAVASFECALDTAAFGTCTSPVTYNSLADGTHLFQVRAIDGAGNVDPTPASFSWTVDTTAPDTQIGQKPSDPSSSPNADFTFTGSDSLVNSVATFECKLDAAAFSPCTSPQSYTALADGSHTFQVRAKDAAGNVDPTPASYPWVISTGVASSVTVGTGGDYASLTNPGGLFASLNSSGANASVTANIISDLTGETGAVALNQLPGSLGLTIKPSGVARTISGNGSALGMIRLFGADNVTIDGSLAGGTDRSLTLTYGNAAGAVVWIGSASASNGATGNIVKNCVISGSAGTTVVAGILSGSGTTLGNAAEAPNSNNTILNNSIYRVQNSLYLSGAAAFDQNWNVTGNIFGSAVTADKNELRGMLISGAQAFTINGNFISGVRSTPSTGAATVGIQLSGSLNGGFVVNNTVRDIKNVSSAGTGAFGIDVTSVSPSANVTIANNFVLDVAAAGSATVVNNGFGIVFDGAGAGGFRLYHNSVNLNTNQASGTTAALLVTGALNSAGALDVRNNIFANSQTSGADRYAIYSGAAANVFSAIDRNDYFAQNVGLISGAAKATLSSWQAATAQDAGSQAVDPLFIGPADLHLRSTSPMVNAAVLIASITSDIDGQSRPIGPANDIGADEMVALLNISGRVVSAGGQPINGATVSLAGGGGGARRRALTNPFGYFTYDNVLAGGTITIAVNSRTFTFTNNFAVITPYTDLTIPDFVADP